MPGVDRCELARLEHLMEQMHQLIRRADFAGLSDLTEGLERSLAVLTARGEPSDLIRLRHIAERNAECLKAAARGVRAANRRLADIIAARAGLRTYDGQGQSARIGGLSGVLKQRL